MKILIWIFCFMVGACTGVILMALVSANRLIEQERINNKLMNELKKLKQE